MNRIADLGGGTRTSWTVSLFLLSALFGFSHYQQGITGIIEEGSDGLILGLMYLACRRDLAIPIVAHGSAIPSTSPYFSWVDIPACRSAYHQLIGRNRRRNTQRADCSGMIWRCSLLLCVYSPTASTSRVASSCQRPPQNAATTARIFACNPSADSAR